VYRSFLGADSRTDSRRESRALEGIRNLFDRKACLQLTKNLHEHDCTLQKVPR